MSTRKTHLFLKSGKKLTSMHENGIKKHTDFEYLEKEATHERDCNHGGLFCFMKKLTKKQLLFVAEYLVDYNATQAAIRAGYSKKTAEVIGYQLLQKTSVQEAIAKATDKRLNRLEISADRVLQELAKLALSDVRCLFDETGKLLPVHMLPDNIAASVSSVEVVTSRIPGTEPVEVEHTSKIKLWDKKGSLELLGKNLKLFNDVGSKENPLEIIQKIERTIIRSKNNGDPTDSNS
jgi:phage terminase small subunit